MNEASASVSAKATEEDKKKNRTQPKAARENGGGLVIMAFDQNLGKDPRLLMEETPKG